MALVVSVTIEFQYFFVRRFVVLKSQMIVTFIHPDLGIGGAERLVVDAAAGLVERGHSVDIYTSHHDHNQLEFYF